MYRYRTPAASPPLLDCSLRRPPPHNASLVFQLVPHSFTLHDWLKLPHALSTAQWLSVALQLAETMETLHRKCVLHNDLHSSNVLIHFPATTTATTVQKDTDCGFSRSVDHGLASRVRRSLAKVKATSLTLPRVTLIDFGHATFREGKVYDEDSEDSLASCRQLAPEVVRHQETSRSSDVFSLGHQLEMVVEALNSSALNHLAQWCKDPDPAARPPASEVVHRLRGMLLRELRAVVSSQHRAAAASLVEDSAARDWQSEASVAENVWPDPPFHHDVVGTVSRPACHPQQWPCSDRNSFHGDGKMWSENSNTKSCQPGVMENAMSRLRLPYITLTGEVEFHTDDMGQKVKIFDSEHTAIFTGQFLSSWDKVVVIKTKKDGNFFSIRYEAMVNAYLNETGWVPSLYGVIPLNKHDLNHFGIVQDMFAQGVTLEEVLERGLPRGITARVELAYQLTSLLHNVHSLHVLINNFKSDNILCACAGDGNCSDIRLIDVGTATGCEGMTYKGEETYLRRFPYLAPEVRRNGLTSFYSDVYSLCVLLDAVLDRQELLEGRDHTEDNGKDTLTHSPGDNGKDTLTHSPGDNGRDTSGDNGRDYCRNNSGDNNGSDSDGDDSGCTDRDHCREESWDTGRNISGDTGRNISGDNGRVNPRDSGSVTQFLETWKSLSALCLGDRPSLRPSTFQLKHFFWTFLKSGRETLI
ncbi:uncharacterized protein LOC143299988 [Babylonia areolata]|uniref:uncharacterized protein LOC143299988 n=1 Tax=Babylonia areolata TaxID=304850 RepID=UPI003FCF928F